MSQEFKHLREDVEGIFFLVELLPVPRFLHELHHVKLHDVVAHGLDVREAELEGGRELERTDVLTEVVHKRL